MKFYRLFSPLLLLGLAACGTTGSEDGDSELVLVRNGGSGYQIVVPDSTANPKDFTGRNLEECAALLRDCVEEGTGVRLPVVPESKRIPGKPGIWLGNTAFARSNGVDLSGMKQWQHLRKTVGSDLILAGLDERGPEGRERTYYSIGTMKAVTTFLQERLGVKFLLPGKNGIFVPKRTILSVPRGELLRKPNLEFCIGVHPGNAYSIANNFYNAPYFNSHGGHSYYDAVPRAKYASAHPEYFAMADGRRNTAADHLCISNPDVRELIYQELVRELDRGFESTELGQTDGYVPCSCGECRKLYGISDPGEKLWIFHRSLAERLKKERPGKKIVILSYGPTANPPRTFRDFPDNVVIELCRYTPEAFAEWNNCSVPGGFMAYIYNWGDYQLQGFTAKFGPKSCEDQIALFSKNHVRGLYRCGFGELFGMEGPLYYAWGRGFDNPGTSVQPLLDEFYESAYGPARAPMKKFFTTLYDRLDYFETAQLTAGKAVTNPMIALAFLYTPDVLLTMEKNLVRAEETENLSAKEKARIALVRSNFKYTENLARIVILYNAYRMEPSEELFAKLEGELNRRHSLIGPILGNRPGSRSIEGWPEAPFGASPQYILRNGRLRAGLGAPFTWDVNRFRKEHILPGKSERKQLTVPNVSGNIPMSGDFESGAWSKASWTEMTPESAESRMPSEFKVLRGADALYVGFRCALPAKRMKQYVPIGHDGPAWEQECLEILLDPDGGRERYFHFILNPVADSCYEAARGYIDDPLHPLYGKPDVNWNGAWEYRSFLDSGKELWTAVVRIPFKSLGMDTAPAQGSRWTANFGREHIPERHANPRLLLWSQSPETSSFHDPDSYGELEFK